MVTGEMVEELILAGADIIKVGIGPGDHSVTLRTQFCVYTELNHIITSNRCPPFSRYKIIIIFCHYFTQFIKQCLKISYLLTQTTWVMFYQSGEFRRLFILNLL